MADAGHNVGELTPDQRSALRMHHVRQLLSVDEEMQPLRDRRKTIRANAKADGFKLSEIDAAIRLSTMEDQTIFVAEIMAMIEIAKAFDALPPGEQGELFPDRRDGEEKGFDAGKVAGLAGDNCEPPTSANTPAGQAWIKGWHEGQRLMGEELQAIMERNNAARAKMNEGADGGDPFDASEAE